VINMDGWEKTKISQFGEIVTGSTPDTQNSDYWGGDIPFVSPSDFNSSAFVLKTDKTLTREGVKQARNISKNSILVTCIGSIGGIAIAPWECVTNQQINSVICREDFDALFIYFLIKNNLCKLQELAGTTTLPIINKSTFGNIEIVCPKSKKEQEKIAEVLFTIDRAIAQTEAIIAKQQRIKTGLMQDLLTKGIDENGNIRSEATHEFKDSAIGRIPVEWKCKDIDSSAYVTKLAGFEFTNYFNYQKNGDVIALRALNIKNEKLDLTDIQTISKSVSDKLPRSKINKDDILITYIGAYIGDILRIEESNKYHLAPNIAKIVAGHDIQASFLELTLRSQSLQQQIQNLIATTATPSLTMTQIRTLCIAFPKNIVEQDLIVKVVKSCGSIA